MQMRKNLSLNNFVCFWIFQRGGGGPSIMSFFLVYMYIQPKVKLRDAYALSLFM